MNDPIDTRILLEFIRRLVLAFVERVDGDPAETLEMEQGIGRRERNPAALKHIGISGGGVSRVSNEGAGSAGARRSDKF